MICAVCLVQIGPNLLRDVEGENFFDYLDFNGYGADVGNDWWPQEWREEWWRRHPDDIIYPGHEHSPCPNGETCTWPPPRKRATLRPIGLYQRRGHESSNQGD